MFNFTSGNEYVLPPGNLVLPPNIIILDGLEDVRIIAHGLVLRCPEPGSVLTIRNCFRVTIEGLTIVGGGPLRSPNTTYCAGILLEGHNESLAFRNLRLVNLPNHGIAHLNGDRTSHGTMVERCRFEHGGNYGRTDGLIWDGAAVAIGGLRTKVIDCSFVDWTRGVEFENPLSDCSFHVERCRFLSISHAAVWITPTGFETKTTGQRFSGRIINCDISKGQTVPNGFNPAGIVCTGGTDILASGNVVSDVSVGIDFSANTAPLSRVILTGNSVARASTGLTYRSGWEGMKCPASLGIVSNNIVCEGVQTPMVLENGTVNDSNLIG